MRKLLPLSVCALAFNVAAGLDRVPGLYYAAGGHGRFVHSC